MIYQQIDAMLSSGRFPEHALGDGPAFSIFPHDSRIRAKGKPVSSKSLIKFCSNSKLSTPIKL